MTFPIFIFLLCSELGKRRVKIPRDVWWYLNLVLTSLRIFFVLLIVRNGFIVVHRVVGRQGAGFELSHQ
jgi:hypothetical protein